MQFPMATVKKNALYIETTEAARVVAYAYSWIIVIYGTSVTYDREHTSSIHNFIQRINLTISVNKLIELMLLIIRKSNHFMRRPRFMLP
jgi:hypothetical protein